MLLCQISVRTAANADAGVGALGEGELEGSSRVGFFFPQLLVVDFELVAGVRGEADHEGLFLVRPKAVGVAISRAQDDNSADAQRIGRRTGFEWLDFAVP